MIDEDTLEAFEDAGRAAAQMDKVLGLTVCATCMPPQPSYNLLQIVFHMQVKCKIRSMSEEVVQVNTAAKTAWRDKLAELSKRKECDYCGRHA